MTDTAIEDDAEELTGVKLEIPLFFPSKIKGLQQSHHLQASIYYYERLWGIFSRGVTGPDPYFFSLFHEALSTLVTAFPLDIDHPDPDRYRVQVELWMRNLRKLGAASASLYLDELTYVLPGGFAFTAAATKEHQREFARAYVMYCIAEGHVDDTSPVNHLAIREKIVQIVRSHVDERALTSKGGACSEQGYLKCLAQTIGHRTLVIPDLESMPIPIVHADE